MRLFVEIRSKVRTARHLVSAETVPMSQLKL